MKEVRVAILLACLIYHGACGQRYKLLSQLQEIKAQRAWMNKRIEPTGKPPGTAEQWSGSTFAPTWHTDGPMDTERPPEMYGNYGYDAFEDLKRLFLFPGSDFILKLMQDHWMADMALTVSDFKDHFEFPACNFKDFSDKVFLVFRETQDAEGTALLFTRHLIKLVHDERMKCPASIIDGAVFRVLQAHKKDVIREESMHEFFLKMAPLIDPAFSDYAEDIARRGAEQLHAWVFNDTTMFMMAFSMKDVAFTSHYMFYSLKHFFEHMPGYRGPEWGLEEMIKGSMWNISCPSYQQIADNHRSVIWKFLEQFEAMETGDLCIRVEQFLHEYARTWMHTGYQPQFDHEQLWTVCQRIHEWIGGVMKGYREYDEKLYFMDMWHLEGMMQNILKDYEWEVVKEAASRLGFFYHS